MKSLLVLAPALSLFLVPMHGQSFPDGPGKDIYVNACGGCHGADIVIGQTGTREVWQDTVDSMRSRGATGSDEDFKVIVDYLTKNFGVPAKTASAPAPAAAAAPATVHGFPDGPGREVYENACGGCHGADIVIGQTGTRDVWQDTVDSMRGRGAAGSDEDFKLIVDYLTVYFGVPVNVNSAPAKDLTDNLNLTSAEADAIVKARTAKKISDYDELSKVEGLDIKKLDPIKSRIKF